MVRAGAPEPPEDAILQAASRGDVEAFNSLVLAYQSLVYSLARRALNNPEDAADAAQDVFLRAFRSLPGYRGTPDGFVAWLLRIASNRCYDYLRQRQRRPSLALVPSDENEQVLQDQALSGPDDDPETRMLGAETARVIQQGLLSLAPDQRLAIILCDVQGLPYSTAAEALNTEVGTVKSRLSRGRAILREFLVARGELPAGRRRLRT